jgi:Flp pilus assembly protein TadG
MRIRTCHLSNIGSPAGNGLKSARGQSVVEFAMVLPFMLMVALGVIEMGYALYEDHLIVKLAREGANLISRNSTLTEAETALQAAISPPVAFNANGKLILSVVKLGTGGANLNVAIISQRRVVGTLAANSAVGNPASSAYNGSPNYNAINADNDTTIRVPGALPNGLTLTAGQSVYITEVYTRHNYITPFDKFGYTLPSTLYASAFF